MSVKGKVLQGEQASADKKMMEEGDTGDTAEQEKAELEAEGIRLKKEEEKIRNEQVEGEKELKVLENKLEKVESRWREDHRSLYKVRKILSEIDVDIAGTDIKIMLLEKSGDLEKLMESRNHLKQQNDRFHLIYLFLISALSSIVS
jgi:chromosome segregation ATPase